MGNDEDMASDDNNEINDTAGVPATTVYNDEDMASDDNNEINDTAGVPATTVYNDEDMASNLITNENDELLTTESDVVIQNSDKDDVSGNEIVESTARLSVVKSIPIIKRRDTQVGREDVDDDENESSEGDSDMSEASYEDEDAD